MAQQRVLLSGSTNGRPIKVAATTSPGTTIHTATSDATALDQVYLWASNTDSVVRTVTVQWGGTTDPDDMVAKAYSIAANSAPTVVASGLPLANALVIKVFASSANVVTVSGYVLRSSR